MLRIGFALFLAFHLVSSNSHAALRDYFQSAVACVHNLAMRALSFRRSTVTPVFTTYFDPEEPDYLKRAHELGFDTRRATNQKLIREMNAYLNTAPIGELLEDLAQMRHYRGQEIASLVDKGLISSVKVVASVPSQKGSSDPSVFNYSSGIRIMIQPVEVGRGKTKVYFFDSSVSVPLREALADLYCLGILHGDRKILDRMWIKFEGEPLEKAFVQFQLDRKIIQVPSGRQPGIYFLKGKRDGAITVFVRLDDPKQDPNEVLKKAAAKPMRIESIEAYDTMVLAQDDPPYPLTFSFQITAAPE